MTPELRDKIEAAMKAGEGDKKAIHENVMKVRTEAIALMKQEPFDEQAFRAKVGEMFALMGQMGDHIIDTMVSIAKDANAQDRAVIAEILIRPPGPGPEGRGPEDRGPDGQRGDQKGGRDGGFKGDFPGGPQPGGHRQSPDASEEALPDHP